MRDLTKRIFWASIASTLVMLLFGILLFIFPETVIKSVAIAMGVIFIMIGVIPIINYFRLELAGRRILHLWLPIKYWRVWEPFPTSNLIQKI